MNTRIYEITALLVSSTRYTVTTPPFSMCLLLPSPLPSPLLSPICIPLGSPYAGPTRAGRCPPLGRTRRRTASHQPTHPSIHPQACVHKRRTSEGSGTRNSNAKKKGKQKKRKRGQIHKGEECERPGKTFRDVVSLLLDVVERKRRSVRVLCVFLVAELAFSTVNTSVCIVWLIVYI